MSAGLPGAMVRLAARCLGDHRREWAQAMEAEFETAAANGEALIFATGCLVAALREMPAHAEGRFALASQVLAVGLLVPLATLLFWGALHGFPYLAPGPFAMSDFLFGRSAQLALLHEANWAIAPSLTGLVLALAASQLALAWFVLERDWSRVVALQLFSGAILTTLVIVSALLAIDGTRLFAPVAVLAIEALAVLAASRWHAQLPRGAWSQDPGG